MRRTIPFLVAALALAACNENGEHGKPDPVSAVERQAVDQEKFCQVGFNAIFAKPDCKPGRKIAFLPDRFGNEQLPLLFAMQNCDLRYEVAMTRGGVVCIYLPSKQAEPEKTEPQEQGREDKKSNG